MLRTVDLIRRHREHAEKTRECISADQQIFVAVLTCTCTRRGDAATVPRNLRQVSSSLASPAQVPRILSKLGA